MHTIGNNTVNLESDDRVPVYEGKEFKQFKELSDKGNFIEGVFNGDPVLKKKYLGLIPCFLEGRFKPKNYVLKIVAHLGAEPLLVAASSESSFARWLKALKQLKDQLLSCQAAKQ